jgi:FixJ family two-component response regulator/HPt (histidine-containing phosphotransfer) domain-containing protein
MTVSSSDLVDTFEQELATLRLGFAMRVPDRIAELETAWQKTYAETIWHIEDLKEVHRLAHSLAGSGASYGFMAVAQTARALEVYLKTEILTNPPTSETYYKHYRTIADLLANLQHAVQKPEELYPLASSLMGVAEVESWLRINDERTVYIVEPDTRLVQDVSAQLGNFGYKVSLFTNLSEINATDFKAPSALLVNFEFGTDGIVHTEILERLQNAWQKVVPVIFISVFADLQARLAAVRAGAAAYFTKPLEINSLVDQLDRLTTREAPEPYRILIVEDDPSLSALYSLSLQQAGILPQLCPTPCRLCYRSSSLRPTSY